MRLRLILWLIALCTVAFALGRWSGHRDALMNAAKRTPVAATAPTGVKPAPHPVAPPLPSNDADEDSGPQDIAAVASYEDLMYAQPGLIDASLAKLRAQTPGKTDLYALGFAGDAAENVFRNEVDYLPKLLAQRFGAEGRTMELINSPATFEHTPLATRTNLYEALAGIARKMDVDDDILLLFLTSHGSADHEAYVEMGTLPLDQIQPGDLRDALDKAHIRWRIVVISACYSGGFIPALRDPYTLVITAARGDRASFGCGSDSQLTWFGKAFLTDALNQTTDFHDAFRRAEALVSGWEKRDRQIPSDPQYWIGSAMQKKLDAWSATLAPGAPVPFKPAPIARPASAR